MLRLVFTPQLYLLLIVPTRSGMLRLIWTGCLVLQWGGLPRHKTIAHPGTNRALCRVTTLIESGSLPPSQTVAKYSLQWWAVVCMHAAPWVQLAANIQTFTVYKYIHILTPPYLNLAASEMWCWSGGREVFETIASVLHYGVLLLHKDTTSSFRSVDWMGLWSGLV